MGFVGSWIRKTNQFCKDILPCFVNGHQLGTLRMKRQTNQKTNQNQTPLQENID